MSDNDSILLTMVCLDRWRYCATASCRTLEMRSLHFTLVTHLFFLQPFLVLRTLDVSWVSAFRKCMTFESLNAFNLAVPPECDRA